MEYLYGCFSEIHFLKSFPSEVNEHKKISFRHIMSCYVIVMTQIAILWNITLPIYGNGHTKYG